jgi:hypothetical protein
MMRGWSTAVIRPKFDSGDVRRRVQRPHGVGDVERFQPHLDAVVAESEFAGTAASSDNWAMPGHREESRAAVGPSAGAAKAAR